MVALLRNCRLSLRTIQSLSGQLVTNTKRSKIKSRAGTDIKGILKIYYDGSDILELLVSNS